MLWHSKFYLICCIDMSPLKTFSTETVDFFSFAIIVETADIFISVLINSSSLFLNLLIFFDVGQVKISSDNQLGPLTQLFLFDDNSSAKHAVDGRSAIFYFRDRWYHISIFVNSLTSLTQFCENLLHCFFSFWIHANVSTESENFRYWKSSC